MQINVIPLILKYVRNQKGYSQGQIAKILNTTQQQIWKYESENPKYNQEIPVRHIVTLARLYNVSADYLLGLTDVADPYPREPDPGNEDGGEALPGGNSGALPLKRE